MYIVYNITYANKITQCKLYKTRGTAQSQCTRRNKYSAATNYVVRQVELKLI